ncbi:MAG: adenylate/guanylate cyclase domain-containing protein [Myxococcota bacterium]|nr:adenylate/guanylate cyclase domain-containing protein [Myxococcota bacterium]
MPRHPRLDALAQTETAPEVVAAISELIERGADGELARINVLRFAEERKLSPDRTIDGFVHATRLGLFEMVWNVSCPQCGDVLERAHTAKQVRSEPYGCIKCVAAYEPTLDEQVEVAFTVSATVRKIAAHSPVTLSVPEYFRLFSFGPRLDVPRGGPEFDATFQELSPAMGRVAPHQTQTLRLEAKAGMAMLFDAVSHYTGVLYVEGEPTQSLQTVPVVMAGDRQRDEFHARPGPLELRVENRLGDDAVLALHVLDERTMARLAITRPFLTAKRLFTNQTFRNLYRTEALDFGQRLKIERMTILFTDLKGSTELYERVGDLAAFELVQKHFAVLEQVARAQGGSVVKTIGDAVMASFPSATQGFDAALQMRTAIDAFNSMRGGEDVLIKIGLHQGPCLAVLLNDRLDYFGQTVNIAARVQGLAEAQAICTTTAVLEDAQVAPLLSERGLAPRPRRAALKGIRDEVTVYDL